MEALPRGLCVILPTALLEDGSFDAESQERLLARLPKGLDLTLFSALAAEGLSLEQSRAVNASVHYAAGPRAHFAGLVAPTIAEALTSLEELLSLGLRGLILSPMLLKDSKDPEQFFHRYLLPRLEGRARALSLLLDDALGAARLKTANLKQLSRLEPVSGALVSGGAKEVGNYLKAARHFKARHEFGAYLSDASLIFRLFRPVRSTVDALRDQWTRLWLGELPQGIAPLSGALFPEAWATAWSSALAGDVEKMNFFESGFDALGVLGFSELRFLLKELGIFRFGRAPEAERELKPSEAEACLERYRKAQESFSKLLILPPPKSSADLSVSQNKTLRSDLAGIGGVVLDEIYPVNAILGAESKVKLRGQPERLPGGVMLNQLSWLAALGVPVSLFGYVGPDRSGAWLRQEARRRGIEVSSLKAAAAGTELAKIFVDPKGAREIYLQPGAVCGSSAESIRLFEGLIEATPFLSLEISLLPLKAVKEAMRLAKKHGKKVFLDLDIPITQACGKAGLGSKSDLMSLLRGADYLKSSKEFLKELAPNLKACYRVLGKKKGQWLAATDGVRGSEIYDGQSLERVKIKAVKEPLDSTGCGDAYMAGLIAGTLWGWSLEAMGQLASACGAACVSRFGGAAPLGEAQALILKQAPKLPLPLPPRAKQMEASTSGQGASFMQDVLEELEALGHSFSDDSFVAAKAMIREAEAQGRRLHVTGVGKPEYVAGYIASSFSSTGTPAFFLHATEAGHGASGQVSPGDLVIAISNSGETEELKSAVATVKRNGAKVIGVTSNLKSWLARQSDLTLFAGVSREGDSLNLAPRASVLAEILVLSALGVELQEEKAFSAEDFRNFHPGGALGKRR